MPDPTPAPAPSTDQLTTNALANLLSGKSVWPFIVVLLIGGGGNMIGQLLGTTDLKDRAARIELKLEKLSSDIEALKAAQTAEYRYTRNRDDRLSGMYQDRDFDGDPTRDSLKAAAVKRGAGGQATP